MAGVEHVGLGGDFAGTDDVTAGLEDVSTYPALFAGLLHTLRDSHHGSDVWPTTATR